MWSRSIFTAFILSVTTVQAWAQTVPAAAGPTPGAIWRPAAYGAVNGVVPAAATSPAPLSPDLGTSGPPPPSPRPPLLAGRRA